MLITLFVIIYFIGAMVSLTATIEHLKKWYEYVLFTVLWFPSWIALFVGLAATEMHKHLKVEKK